MSPSASATRVPLVLESHLLDLNHKHVFCQHRRRLLRVAPLKNTQHSIKTSSSPGYLISCSPSQHQKQFCLVLCLFPIMPVHDTLWQFLLEVTLKKAKPSKNTPIQSFLLLQSLGSGPWRRLLARVQLHPQCADFMKIPELKKFLRHGMEA